MRAEPAVGIPADNYINFRTSTVVNCTHDGRSPAELGLDADLLKKFCACEAHHVASCDRKGPCNCHMEHAPIRFTKTVTTTQTRCLHGITHEVEQVTTTTSKSLRPALSHLVSDDSTERQAPTHAAIPPASPAAPLTGLSSFIPIRAGYIPEPGELTPPTTFIKDFYVVTAGLEVGIFFDAAAATSRTDGISHNRRQRVGSWEEALAIYTGAHHEGSLMILPPKVPATASISLPAATPLESEAASTFYGVPDNKEPGLRAVVLDNGDVFPDSLQRDYPIGATTLQASTSAVGDVQASASETAQEGTGKEGVLLTEEQREGI
ncbi:hypothetical protein NLJ89_g10452 [Agrocybe chaxingu]|uniref:Uncharacterized protein n=1 Tax=Agrocybe chaxingu TaxID=84603 RepID=A0A9W8MNX3_9AGAR|nr:hypothetical protein NLJ89_g10452 [Agrocybe chaxingu]